MPIHLENIRISGGRTGIRVNGPIQLSAKNINFDNVKVPFDISAGAQVDIKGTRIVNKPRADIESKAVRSKQGWRRLNGPPLPVFCPECKSIFPSESYVFAGMYFNLWDNEEVCPNCGSEHAKLSEGVFDLSRDVVHALAAPDVTHVMLKYVLEIVQSVSTGDSDPSAAASKIAGAIPRIGAIFERARAFGDSALNLLMAVIAIATLAYTVELKNLAESQEQLTKEQIMMERSSSASMDVLLEQILRELSHNRIDPKGAHGFRRENRAPSWLTPKIGTKHR